MTTFVDFGAHQEDPDSKRGSVTWPATSSLAYNPGDWVIKNRGPQLTYTGNDGTVITFASVLRNTTFSGTGTGSTATNAYDGPYATCAPGTYDPEDEAFCDIELWGDMSYFKDINTGNYFFTPRNGDVVIVGSHVADGAIGPPQLTKNHPHRGQIAGGHLQINGHGGAFLFSGFFATVPNSTDVLYWKTDDGSGDSTTGQHQGQYQILETFGANDPLGGTGYAVGAFIWDHATNSTGPITTFPYWNAAGPYFQTSTFANPGSPLNCIISFCTLFPGIATSVSGSPTGGSLTAGHTYRVRYCYYKNNFTLATNAGMADGNGGYTQTIETPLSSPTADIVMAAGANTCKITATIPPPDATMWDGVSVYIADATAGGPWQQAAYSAAGNVYTITGPAATPYQPSCGWAAWPSGTWVVKDKRAIRYGLMKWGHTNPTADPDSGAIQVTSYHGATQTVTSTAGSKSTLGTYHPMIATGGQAPTSTFRIPSVHPTDTNRWTFLDPSTLGGGLPAGAEGDLLYYHSGAWVVLAPSNGSGTARSALLGLSGGDPSWLGASATNGNVVRSDGTNWGYGALDLTNNGSAANGGSGNVLLGGVSANSWGQITDSQVSASAGILGSKLANGDSGNVLLGGASSNSWGQIADSQVSSSAGIQVSKLAGSGAPGGSVLATGASPYTPSWISSGTANYPLLSNGSGALPSFGQIVDASVSGSAAIALTKLAALSQYGLLTNNGTSNINAVIISSGDAGSFTTDGSGSWTGTVSFGLTFVNPPIVICGMGGDFGSGAIAYANWGNQGGIPSTSQFTANVKHATPSTGFSHLYWIAIVTPSSW